MDIQNNQVMRIALGLSITDPTTHVSSPTTMPAGDTFTAVCSNPNSLGVSIVSDGAGGFDLQVQPLVQLSNATNGGGNFVITVTDSAGSVQAGLSGLNIVPPPVVRNITLGNPTFSSQATPAAPGP